MSVRIERATIHMVLATYEANNSEEQVRKMARRYLRRASSARTRKTMRTIISCPDPVRLVRTVYNESIS